ARSRPCPTIATAAAGTYTAWAGAGACCTGRPACPNDVSSGFNLGLESPAAGHYLNHRSTPAAWIGAPRRPVLRGPAPRPDSFLVICNKEIDHGDSSPSRPDRRQANRTGTHDGIRHRD